MKGVELYGRVRYAVQIEGLSHRAAARRFGIDPRTVAKMVRFTAPPGYVRTKPPGRLRAPELPRSASGLRELRSVERLSSGLLPSSDGGPLARP